MELSKLQIITLVVLTTILTDKLLINHSQTISVPNIVATPTATITTTPTPITNVTLSPNTSQNELILKEIQNLRKEMNSTITNLQTQSSIPQAIPTLSSSLIGGMVKINSPQWKKVDVFEKPNSSSKIVNSIIYDTIYFYSTKTSGWYQLSLDNGQSGYVQSLYLAEFP